MTVGDLIELLEQHPKDVEILIDYRSTDNAEIFLQKDWHTDGTPVVLIDT